LSLPIIFELSCIPAGASYTVNTRTQQTGLLFPHAPTGATS
jgi:hypothetical protein